MISSPLRSRAAPGQAGAAVAVSPWAEDSAREEGREHQGLSGKVRVSAATAIPVLIEVKGRYSPDTIVVPADDPSGFAFAAWRHRAVPRPSSSTASARAPPLPTGQEVLVTLPAAQHGTYEFTCAMGMLRGRLVVEATPGRAGEVEA